MAKDPRENLRKYTPAGEFANVVKPFLNEAFPHPIKNAGTFDRASKYLPVKPLRQVTGQPAMIDTRVTVGLGANGPQGRKSVAWKAVVATDEHARMAPLANMQSITAPGNLKFEQKPASRFAAAVSRSNGGAAGIETKPWNGEGAMFGHKNMRMSNLEGTPGVSARSSKYAANVRTAPGKQITTREETFAGGVLKNKKVRNI